MKGYVLMFILFSSTTLLQYGRGDLEVGLPGQGLVSLQGVETAGKRTERTLK